VVEAGPPNSLRRRAAKKPELFSIAGFTAAEKLFERRARLHRLRRNSGF
jgi:hypothetical protein